MGSLTDGNACYGGNSESFGITEDLIGGGLGGTYLSPGQCGGGKRKKMRTKKRGSSKRKNRKVSTLRKKRGSSKRKNRGSLKRRKHSKREVVKSIMKGLGEKRKSRKKSIKGGDRELDELLNEIRLRGTMQDENDAEKCLKNLFGVHRLFGKKKCLRKVLDGIGKSPKSTSIFWQVAQPVIDYRNDQSIQSQRKKAARPLSDRQRKQLEEKAGAENKKQRKQQEKEERQRIKDVEKNKKAHEKELKEYYAQLPPSESWSLVR